MDCLMEIKVAGALLLVGTCTQAPGGVCVLAEHRWGSFPREGFRPR